MKFFKEHKWFTLLLILASVIRFIPLAQYQYSFDELSALSRTTYANWHDLVMYGARIDAHPILIQCFLYAFIKVFGYSEVWIKLAFILFSLAAIYYAYKTSLKWFGEVQALLVASIYSFSFIFLFYSPLARMYASGLFFCTALLYYWMNVVFDEKKNKRDYWLMGLFILLCALNAHLSTLFALTLGIAGLIYQNKQSLLTYLAACVIPVICYLPHLPITLFQLQYGGIGAEQNGWLPLPGKWAFLEFITTALGTGWVWLMFVFLIVVSFVSHRKEVANKKSIVLLVVFFVNYFVIYFYSVLKAPVFQFSVMLFSAPALLVALTGMIRLKEGSKVPVMVVVSVVLLFQSVYSKEYFASAVLNQNEFCYRELKSLTATYGDKNVDAVFYDTEKYFVMHYELRDGKKQNYHMGYEEEFATEGKLVNYLSNTKAQKFLIGNAMPAQLEIVKSFFPYLEKFTETTNVSCYVFSKTPVNNLTEEPIHITNQSEWKNSGDYIYNFNKEKYASNHSILRVDSLDEYPFNITAELKNVASVKGNVVMAELSLQSDSVLQNASFNCIIKSDKDSTLYFGGPELTGFYLKDKTYKAYCQFFVGSGIENWLEQNAKITFFVWNRGKNKFQIQDAHVATYDYRPKRWNLWK